MGGSRAGFVIGRTAAAATARKRISVIKNRHATSHAGASGEIGK